MDSYVLTPDQQKRLGVAQKGLCASVEHCQYTFLFSEKSPLIHDAKRGIVSLSPAETLWLNQKDWEPIEKTFLLYHVHAERNKKKRLIPLKDIGITAALSLAAGAAYYKDYRYISAMLAVVAAAKAMDTTINHVQDYLLHKMTNRHLNHVKHTNDHVQTGMRCLARRTMQIG